MQQLAPGPSLQDWPSYGLVSLWDMLKPYARQFVALAELITELKQFKPQYDATPTLASILKPTELDKKIRAYWPGLKHLTETIPLPSVVPQMDRIGYVLDRMHTQEEIIALMAALYDRLGACPSSRWIF